MDKKTIFAITFFLLSLIVLFMAYEGAPEHYGGSRYQTPSPKTVEVGNINFTVPAGYFENDNPQKINLPDNISNKIINKYQKSFKQNEILLLDITVFELEDNIDLNILNDGTFTHKTIYGIDGIFKSSEVTTSASFVKNTHLRYYFNYIDGDKLVMIQCDNLKTLENMIQ